MKSKLRSMKHIRTKIRYKLLEIYFKKTCQASAKLGLRYEITYELFVEYTCSPMSPRRRVCGI